MVQGIFGDLPWFSLDFPWISHGFPWFLHGFPWIIVGFALIFPGFPCFFLVFQWFSMNFLLFNGFSGIFWGVHFLGERGFFIELNHELSDNPKQTILDGYKNL